MSDQDFNVAFAMLVQIKNDLAIVRLELASQIATLDRMIATACDVGTNHA